MAKRKFLWIGLFILLIVLVLTNPTSTDFKNRIPSSIFTGEQTSDWGIFSLYKAVGISKREGRADRIYLGIFKKFILIKAIRPK